MASTEYHEPYELLSKESRDMHRAIVSAIEELEAIDWYQQRADACTDEDLKRVLLHNKDEEIEHLMMNLEWMRRRDPRVHEQMKTYLFTEAPIEEIEDEEKAAGGPRVFSPSLKIGSLKEESA